MSFAYNGDGLRQSKTVDGVTTRFVYDGMRLLQETNTNGTTQVTYTLAPRGGEWHLLISDTRHPSLATRHYTFDMLGTTRALTDANQSVTATFTEDAYGNTLAATDPSATPHQYVGRLGYYLDGASGLQLLTQRYYDGGVGRFVSEDPVRDGGDRFRYVRGIPTVVADPIGLWTVSLGGGGAVVVPGGGVTVSVTVVFDGCCNAGLLFTIGGGPGLGAGVSGGVQAGTTNAPQIPNLHGRFDFCELLAGWAAGVDASGTWSPAPPTPEAPTIGPPSPGPTIAGGDISVTPMPGLTFGAGAFCGESWTWAPSLSLRPLCRLGRRMLRYFAEWNLPVGFRRGLRQYGNGS